MGQLRTPGRRTLDWSRRINLVAISFVAAILVPLALGASPAAAGGTHKHHQPPNGCVNSKYVRGPCSLSLSTSVTSPGSTILVSGTGFQPTSSVTLYFDSNGYSGHQNSGHYRSSHANFNLGSVTTDSSGDFTDQQVTIPLNAPFGQGEIQANGLNRRGGYLVLDADLRILHTKPTKDSTTTAVAESETSTTFGAENTAIFTVTITPGLGETGPSGDSVLIHIGTAQCAAFLTNGVGTCHIGATELPVGGPYAVSATFPGDAKFTGSSLQADRASRSQRAPRPSPSGHLGTSGCHSRPCSSTRRPHPACR